MSSDFRKTYPREAAPTAPLTKFPRQAATKTAMPSTALPSNQQKLPTKPLDIEAVISQLALQTSNLAITTPVPKTPYLKPTVPRKTKRERKAVDKAHREAQQAQKQANARAKKQARIEAAIARVNRNAARQARRDAGEEGVSENEMPRGGVRYQNKMQRRHELKKGLMGRNAARQARRDAGEENVSDDEMWMEMGKKGKKGRGRKNKYGGGNVTGEIKAIAEGGDAMEIEM